MSKQEWVYLTKLYIRTFFNKTGNNKIGDTECAHLKQGDWKYLTNLTLCTDFTIQVITKSERMDVISFERETGKISPF